MAIPDFSLRPADDGLQILVLLDVTAQRSKDTKLFDTGNKFQESFEVVIYHSSAHPSPSIIPCKLLIDSRSSFRSFHTEGSFDSSGLSNRGRPLQKTGKAVVNISELMKDDAKWFACAFDVPFVSSSSKGMCPSLTVICHVLTGRQSDSLVHFIPPPSRVNE